MTCRNRRYIDRKRSEKPRVTSEDRYLIVSSKRNGRKTAPQQTVEFNSTHQHTISVRTDKRRLLSAGRKGCISVKKKTSIKKEVEKIKMDIIGLWKIGSME